MANDTFPRQLTRYFGLYSLGFGALLVTLAIL